MRGRGGEGAAGSHIRRSTQPSKSNLLGLLGPGAGAFARAGAENAAVIVDPRRLGAGAAAALAADFDALGVALAPPRDRAAAALVLVAAAGRAGALGELDGRGVGRRIRRHGRRGSDEGGEQGEDDVLRQHGEDKMYIGRVKWRWKKWLG